MSIRIGINQAARLLAEWKEKAVPVLSDPERAGAAIDDLEARLSRLPASFQIPEECGLLVKAVRTHFSGEGSLSPETLTSLLGAALYYEERDDLIPDDLSAIGVADDLSVLALAIRSCRDELEAFR